ncbi:MAG TPA: hypothetical protein VM366_01760 [Anaerolineae bacterium]|nr:hypothetical protein [Anaerolineae bacterium]
MLERVHEHIVSELGQSARTDTIFVITAVVFNLVVLGINSAVAGEAANGGDVTGDTILGVLIVVSLIINTIAVAALYVGQGTRNKLLEGLLAMYRDNEVAQYYDVALLTNYGRRYWLFTGVIVCLALTGIVVPLIIRMS